MNCRIGINVTRIVVDFSSHTKYDISRAWLFALHTEQSDGNSHVETSPYGNSAGKVRRSSSACVRRLTELLLTPTQKENMMITGFTTKTAAPLIDLQCTQPLPSFRSASKPRFLNLINLHRVSMWRIARTAGVPIGVVHTMLYNQPINPMQAAQVLAAFRRLTGTTYTLNDLSMRLLPISLFGEKEDQHA